MKIQNKAQELIAYYLSDSCDQAMDYDNLYAELAEEDSESFDLFVRLSYNISEMELTVPEIRKAANLIATLARHTLQFNLLQSDNCSDEMSDACM